MRVRPVFGSSRGPILVSLLGLVLAGCGGAPVEAPATPPSEATAYAQPDEASAPGQVTTGPMGPVRVTMYMTSWCPVCARAREWMTSQGYDFVEYDVETDVRAGRVMRAINPRGTVPMFEIDRMILIGFSPEMLRRAIARADARRREDAPAPP